MALSSDEIIKREVADSVKVTNPLVKPRIFPQSSRADQDTFSNGGLTFGFEGVLYGSCDACWFTDEEWVDGYDNTKINKKPIIALEGTDALRRGSSGNAQYQRFHHALGAVKNGVLGVYYLKPGPSKIQPDLYGMAYFASKVEKGNYLIVNDLTIVADILNLYGKAGYDEYVENYLDEMYKIFDNKFQQAYQGDWQNFANKRSTVIEDDCIIKYAARNRRNFTDGSQRAGHIAVGEMYLTKYLFPDKPFFYLFPRMTDEDVEYLDTRKKTDKEWYLLRNEPNVFIKTSDDIIGLDNRTKRLLISIKDEPLKGRALAVYAICSKKIFLGLQDKTLTLKR